MHYPGTTGSASAWHAHALPVHQFGLALDSVQLLGCRARSVEG